MNHTSTTTPGTQAAIRRAIGIAIAVVAGAVLLLGLLAGALGEPAPATAGAAPAPAPAVTAPVVPDEPGSSAPDATAPGAEALPGSSRHTVAAGETLARIAVTSGVPVELLAADNGLADPDRLTAGQVLTVSAAPSNVVVIAPGDTLGEQAERLGTTVDALMDLNPQIADPDRIDAGDGLRVARG